VISFLETEHDFIMFACRAQILKLLQNSFVLMEYWRQSFDTWGKREYYFGTTCCIILVIS